MSLYLSKSDLICCKLPAMSLSNFLHSPFYPPWNQMMVQSLFFLLLQPSVDTTTHQWPLSLSSAIHLLSILLWVGLTVFFFAVCMESTGLTPGTCCGKGLSSHLSLGKLQSHLRIHSLTSVTQTHHL